MERTIKILVVYEEPLMRLGIKSSLLALAPDIFMEAEANDTKTASLILSDQIDLDLVILDAIFQDGDASKLIELIHQNNPETKILVLTSRASEEVLKKLIKLGINGLAYKNIDSHELVAAIRTIASGSEYFSEEVAKLRNAVQPKEDLEPINFTAREMEILKLTAQGKTAGQIAEQLFLSHRTVESHKHNIFRKLRINSTSELIRYAFQHGIAKP